MQGLREAKAKRQHTLKAIDILDDVLEEVLLRLPVKSLMRFKSVCKSWHDIIGSLHFERRQLLLAMARQPSMLILPVQLLPPSRRMDKIKFFAYPGHGTVAELMCEKLCSPGIRGCTQPIHCDGLVVVAAALSSQIFVCNPATKELVLLPTGSPDCSKKSQMVGFSVDTSTGEYKVVRFLGGSLMFVSPGDVASNLQGGDESRLVVEC
ncbi:hypothetical protein QOZ80_3BG0297760 [Eleusine coracana subsp. coracana]|nr:hypothetical protein QOZ80_3BG0297760 [Eleusine coracana subsp. coracana]